MQYVPGPDLFYWLAYWLCLKIVDKGETFLSLDLLRIVTHIRHVCYVNQRHSFSVVPKCSADGSSCFSFVFVIVFSIPHTQCYTLSTFVTIWMHSMMNPMNHTHTYMLTFEQMFWTYVNKKDNVTRMLIAWRRGCIHVWMEDSYQCETALNLTTCWP